MPDLKVNRNPVVIKTVPLVSQLLRSINMSNLKPLTVKDNPYGGKVDQTTNVDPELYKSALGTPVVINLTLKSVTYTDLQTNQQKTTDDLTFDTVLCTVMQAKKIIKTEIQGRDGTIKEYIGMDDYNLNINGILVGDNRHYPVDQVMALKRMLDAPVPIPVVSSYLNNLGIYNIVVTDYTLPQEAGGYSKQDFSINAVSDIPTVLQMA